MLKKRAQGLSMNVIIVAALALLVLVVLTLIFTGRMSLWGSQVSDCENKGGTCRDTCEEGESRTTLWKCPPEAEAVCCITDYKNQ